MASVISLLDRSFDIVSGKSTDNQGRVVWRQLLGRFDVELKERALDRSMHLFFSHTLIRLDLPDGGNINDLEGEMVES